MLYNEVKRWMGAWERSQDELEKARRERDAATARADRLAAEVERMTARMRDAVGEGRDLVDKAFKQDPDGYDGMRFAEARSVWLTMWAALSESGKTDSALLPDDTQRREDTSEGAGALNTTPDAGEGTSPLSRTRQASGNRPTDIPSGNAPSTPDLEHCGGDYRRDDRRFCTFTPDASSELRFRIRCAVSLLWCNEETREDADGLRSAWDAYLREFGSHEDSSGPDAIGEAAEARDVTPDGRHAVVSQPGQPGGESTYTEGGAGTNSESPREDCASGSAAEQPAGVPSSPSSPGGKREAFEAWARGHYDTRDDDPDTMLRRDSCGYYDELTVQGAWEGWQARSRAAPSLPSREHVAHAIAEARDAWSRDQHGEDFPFGSDYNAHLADAVLALLGKE